MLLPLALVVFVVRKQVLHVDSTPRIVDADNEPIAIALDIEDRYITHWIGMWIGRARLRQVAPARSSHDPYPCRYLYDAVAMSLRQPFEATLGDDAHRFLFLLSPALSIGA